MLKKSVISLISYDAHRLPSSIKSYYEYVDEIVLGLDKDRVTWSGNKFKINEDELWKELSKIDGDGKIKIVEDNFHQSSIALENDNFERNLLKSKCSHDWIFSFDADEQLINAKDFFYNFLPLTENYYKKADLLFTWFLPYKEFENEYAMICHEDGTFFRGDTQGFATSKDSHFTYCRWTEKRKRIMTPLAIMHWSFCRNEAELDQKLGNFGHSDKSRNDPFFATWKLINTQNYTQLRNFKTSGFGENQWSKLQLVPKDQLFAIAEQQAKLIM